jgi:hypothetical protein
VSAKAEAPKHQPVFLLQIELHRETSKSPFSTGAFSSLRIVLVASGVPGNANRGHNHRGCETRTVTAIAFSPSFRRRIKGRRPRWRASRYRHVKTRAVRGAGAFESNLKDSNRTFEPDPNGRKPYKEGPGAYRDVPRLHIESQHPLRQCRNGH